MVTPAVRREAVVHLIQDYEVSQRRACEVLGAARSIVRYVRQRADDITLRSRLRELAHERKRFGYRRLHQMLKREGIVMNIKRLRRLYTEERLQVRKRGGRKRALGSRSPMTIPQGPNQRGSVRNLVRGAGFILGLEPVSKDDSELSPRFKPFSRRRFPSVVCVVENQIQ